jgi:hypothetical protein
VEVDERHESESERVRSRELRVGEGLSEFHAMNCWRRVTESSSDSIFVSGGLRVGSV